ncbi:hypothetical protein EZV62_003150 [Acer yangbiense]|uniref:Uncharacterized protein n=1 Tax=Acer yangbiense TaxID=1000413 RepID=A0A5C7IGP2_9ROSI|nr:hypothetical protein EZV62_003150 [Acer yangbiense]
MIPGRLVTIAIFVLGDSVYDPGNNDYLDIGIDGKANFPPYGETFFCFPTGRFCDGRQIPDFAGYPLKMYLAMYANLPIWEVIISPMELALQLNIRIQLGYLKEVANLLKEELGDTEAKNILENAIYLSSFGGVDYMAFINNTYIDFTQSKMEEYVKMVLGNLTEVTKEIDEMGGRKFAFQNVGPLGCQPELKQQYNLSDKACVEELQTIASQHNNALSNVTRELESQLSGFNYLSFDFFNALNDMTSHLEKYGFKVSDIASCGTGSRRGSDCGRSGESNVTWPLNMKQLYELESSADHEYVSDDGALFKDE